MKIKCQKQYFLKALQTITGIAVQKDIYPILENVRISTIEETVVLRATDLKISITYTFSKEQVTVLEPGELLLPASRLHSLVKETPDAEIDLEQEDFNGVLTTSDGKFRILGEDPQKFPEVPRFQEQVSIEISGENFRKLIKKTLFATTPEKTRYDLDNVLVDVASAEEIRFVATDGKRLAICDKSYKMIGKVEKKRFPVPAQGLQQIDRVLSATMPEVVTLSFLENQLLFRTEDVVLSTRLSDAKFPPYEKVMPSSLPFKAVVSVKDFASGLRRVCLLADEKNKIVQLSFEGKTLKLFSRGEGTGEACVDIPIHFDGDPFQVKFNPTFLLDVLKVVDARELDLLLQDGQSPLMVQDGDGFKYVVLPIKVEEEKSEGTEGAEGEEAE